MDYSQRETEKRRNQSIEWARKVLDYPEKYLIFETETTGLKEDDLIIHLAVMDLARNMLINTSVKPMSKRRIAEAAQWIHGMKIKDLKDSPRFEEVFKDLLPIIEGKTLLSFYAGFHERMLYQTHENEGVSKAIPLINFDDVQKPFEEFMRRDRLSLPGRDNTGIGDCNATLDVIVEIANGNLVDIPEEIPVVKNTNNSAPQKSSWTWLHVGMIIVGFLMVNSEWWVFGLIIMFFGVFFINKANEKNRN